MSIGMAGKDGAVVGLVVPATGAGGAEVTVDRVLVSVVVEQALCFAAGLSAGDPELSWEQIAAIVRDTGLGDYKADTLVRELDVWLMRKGTSRAKVSAQVRESRRR